MPYWITTLCAGVLVLLVGLVTSTEARMIIARKARSDYTIVIDQRCSPSERHGSEELQMFLGQISGAEFPISYPRSCVIVSTCWNGSARLKRLWKLSPASSRVKKTMTLRHLSRPASRASRRLSQNQPSASNQQAKVGFSAEAGVDRRREGPTGAAFDEASRRPDVARCGG